jgi:hypothetical protein
VLGGRIGYPGAIGLVDYILAQLVVFLPDKEHLAEILLVLLQIKNNSFKKAFFSYFYMLFFLAHSC